MTAATPHDDHVLETVDHVALTRLQQAYADGVTRRDWTLVHDLFLPSASVTLDLVDRPGRTLHGPDDIVGFVSAAVARFAFFQFVVLNAYVELWTGGERSQATARVFMCELRQEIGSSERSDAFGRYADRYRKVDGRWRIAGRSYRSMARYPEGLVFPLDQ